MKHFKHPSLKDNLPSVPWEQRNYTALYHDGPASEIPNTAVAIARNVLLFGETFRVRPGTDSWWLTPLPSIIGRTDYKLTKTGTAVNRTVGDSFTLLDVGRYIIWPTTGKNDLIVGYTDGDNVTVEDDTAQSTDGGDASIRGSLNQWIKFPQDKLVFIHIDQRVFYSTYQMLTWTEVINRSNTLPSEERSVMDEYKGRVYLFSNGGHFIIDPDGTQGPEMFQLNSNCPDNEITVNSTYFTSEETDTHRFGRRYLNSLSRMIGQGEDDRSSNRIQKESGTNNFPASRNYKDWEAVYKQTVFSPQGNSTGDTRGIDTATPTKKLDEWFDVSEGSIVIQIDSTSREVVCDFSSAKTWFDIAAEFQSRLNATFPDFEDIICTYNAVDEKFIVFVGREENVILFSNVAAGTTGIDLFTAEYFDFNSSEFSNAGALLGTTAQNGLQVPSGQEGWTHYSIYSTLTLGLDFPGRNAEQYIWQNDIPVVKVMLVDVSSGTVQITSSNYDFNRYDLSSHLLIEDGDTDDIDQHNSLTEVVASSLNNNTGVAACIGAAKCMTASLSGGAITWESGFKLTQGVDEGKMACWSDGTFSTIKTVAADGESATTDDTSTKSSLALAFDPTGRNYIDEVEDQALINRAKPFPLIQRLWQPLPSAHLGQIVPGFFTVALEDDEKFYYSQLLDNYEYLVGHHNQEFQFNVIKDSIKGMSEFPNLLIIYGASSIWRTQINVQQFVEESRVGQVVSVMSGLGIVDGSIGLHDKSGIKRINKGVEIIVTSEPGIRMFDGRSFSEELTIDSEGRSYIKSEIQKMRSGFAIAYEPNLLGVMLWGRQGAVPSALSGKFLPDTCWRRAMEPEHGFGFSQFDGDDWVKPEIGIGSLQLESSTGETMTIVMDSASGLPYALLTREGGSGSWPSSRLNFFDKGLTSIDWDIGYKEHTASEERYLLRHMETHNYFRPEKEENKNDEGFDANGFLETQEISVKAYIDGSPTEASLTTDVPNNNDVVFSKLVEGRRIQIVVSGTESSIVGTAHKTLYDVLQVGSSPDSKNIREMSVQNGLATGHILWVTRGKHYPKNLSNGLDPTNENTISNSTGPDGNDNSALKHASSGTPANRTQYALSNVISGDFSLIIWSRHGSSNVQIYDVEENGDFEIRFDSGNLQVVFPSNTYSIDFSAYTRSSWNCMMIVRSGTNLLFYVNGVLDTSMTIVVEAFEGNHSFGSNSGSGASMFDTRFYTKAFSADVAEYYYRDVIDQQAYSLLPLYYELPYLIPPS